MTYTIDDLMRAWKAAGEDMWAQNIRDTQPGYPGDIERIGRIFARAAPWALDLMGGTYSEKHNAGAWCGHTQSNWGLAVGEHLEDDQCVGVYLDPDIARNCLPSTRRMVSAAKWQKAGHRQPEIITAQVAGLHLLKQALEMPRVATIAARIYGDSRDRVGGHFVLITSFDPETKTFETLEGNGWGMLGDGTYGEGVIKRVGLAGEKWDARPLEHLRMVHMFDVDHFEWMGRP